MDNDYQSPAYLSREKRDEGFDLIMAMAMVMPEYTRKELAILILASTTGERHRATIQENLGKIPNHDAWGHPMDEDDE